MKENTVVAFQNPSDFQKDPLTEVLQAGARELLAQAVEAEVSVFLGSHAALVDAAGRRRVVRNGYLPERFIQTGIGPVSVRQPRVRDRGDGAIRFTSAILPRYLRRAKSLEDLLPWLYLKGISTGDFGEALAALLGSSAPGLSASTITRLKEVWGVEAERWQRRDLTAKRYVYFWVDGIYFSACMEEEKQCILVIVGATDKGQKELIAIADGYRESEQSWLEVLLDLKRRGLEMGPQLALGDGALGFWKALRQVYPGAREQRCWVHKTGNVLNKLPKGLQKKAKGRLQDIWMAETRKDAESAFDFFLEAYGPKYDKAAACLAKDRDVLLTFYDFPAEHWKHVRTTNPIESTFATVRLRTYRTKGCLSRKTAMAMVFKLGSIRESYASPCYGGGETGPVIGAGGEADEVEPAQVVVQIAGGDAAAGTQEVLQPAVAAVHRLHMQIAPNPFPHRAVECFVAHPERSGARWVARATVGDQQGVLSDHRVEGSRERRRIDPGQHRADRRPAPVRRHENRHLLARESALLRLAAPPPCLAFQPARALPALQDVGLVRFHDPLEHLRIAPRRRQKPVTPAERRAHRHVAARRRGLHRLPLRQRRPERQPAFLVVQARQRRTGQRVEGSAAALALVAPQTPRHTARNRPFARAVRTAPGLVHTKLDRGLRCLAFAPARQHRERLAPLRALQPARRRKPHLETLAVHDPTS